MEIASVVIAPVWNNTFTNNAVKLAYTKTSKKLMEQISYSLRCLWIGI